MFKNILIALDGSENSINALNLAAEIATQNNAELHIISIIEPLPFIVGGGSSLAYNDVNQTVMQKHYKELHKEQAQRLKKQHPHLKITTTIKEGRPATKITETATDSDLIVIGHRGRGGILSQVLGSVAKQIVDACTVSVLIVKDQKYCQK